MAAKLVLIEAYQQSAGIFDHLNLTQPRPLACVAMHPAENLGLFSPYSDMAERYARAKVWDYFHLSLKEFLDLHHSRIEEILAVCHKLLSEDVAKLPKLPDVK